MIKNIKTQLIIKMIEKKNALMLALQPPIGYYNRKLGGTNFKRRIKRKRLKRKLRG